MRKFIIVLLLLLCAIAFAKTWEASSKLCYEVTGGFWFPDHKWTDKGEPWIKSLMYGEILANYDEYGLYFGYESPGYCFGCDWINPFNVIDGSDYAPNKDEFQIKDSIYFYQSCDLGNRWRCNDKKDLSLENLSIDDFYLATRFWRVDCNAIRDCMRNDTSFSLESFNDKYAINEGIYFIYKKYSDRFEYNALCHFLLGYHIQCEFQDDGTLNFDKLPNARTVPEDYCAAFTNQKVLPVRQPLKNFFANQPSYKINGTPASQSSSNIIIKNNQPTLQLKGEH